MLYLSVELDFIPNEIVLETIFTWHYCRNQGKPRDI